MRPGAESVDQWLRGARQDISSPSPGKGVSPSSSAQSPELPLLSGVKADDQCAWRLGGCRCCCWLLGAAGLT